LKLPEAVTNRKFLQWEQSVVFGGVSIGWSDDASAETAKTESDWAFLRKSPATTRIRYGEPLAILLDIYEPRFVNYGDRKFGIDLVRSKTPSYEWAILGGKPGEHVRRGEDFVVLYNLKYQQPLIYFDRNRGGDIGWPTSRRWGTGNIHDSPQQTAKMRSAARALLMPGVVVGK
jgi:hypothetical protein